MIAEVDAVLRLLAAIILGGIVGYERQSRNKTAGLRTHILVSLGACLVMILSINIHLGFNGPSGGDAARLAAQVVSGIGFLGAGTIMANKKCLNIIGLTTAASLWTVAAIGLALGMGAWVIAGATTAFVYITLSILARLEKRIKLHLAHQCTFVITTVNLPGQLGKIGDYFGKEGINIQEFYTASEDDEKRLLEVFVEVELSQQAMAAQIVAGLLQVEGIYAVKRDQ